MNLELIPFTEDYIIPENGKYLVGTETNFLKKKQYFCADCTRVWNEKKKSFITSVDVNNQVVLLISNLPIK